MCTAYAILGATLIDGSGADPIEHAAVLVDGRQIRAVGRMEKVSVPVNVEPIEAAGRYLLPGLIDSHVHVFTPGFVPIPPKDQILHMLELLQRGTFDRRCR